MKKLAKTIPLITQDIRTEFLSKIEFSQRCWNFRGEKKHRGYTGFRINKVRYPSHRVSYEIFNNTKLPEYLAIDHLCKNPTCVRVDHLEAVTHSENTIRGMGISSINRLKTHCVRGHEFFGNNLYIYKEKDGKVRRVCKKCRALAMKISRQK